jgi:hypothetical protein
MKKLLIIPMFFVYYMGMGQTAITIDSASIIGESITIDDIIIAQNDFPNNMNYKNAISTCYRLGNGWRVPNISDLKILYKYKKQIGGFAQGYYWSSGYYQDFKLGIYNDKYVINFEDDSETAGKVDHYDEGAILHVRPVKSIYYVTPIQLKDIIESLKSAKKQLDRGDITQAEFDEIKQKLAPIILHNGGKVKY